MSATATQIAEVRRMVAEPTSTTYSDAMITALVERFPLLDERGEMPYTWLLAEPPTQQANPLWVATYDLHAAAAEIWTEKAAALAASFDFTADGAHFARSQAPLMAMQMARYHAARRKPKPIWSHVWPKESNLEPYPGNAPEDNA